MAKLSKPYTEAGKKYLSGLTEWLQETRLLSEAAHRLRDGYEQTGKIEFSEKSWPRKVLGTMAATDFTVKPVELAQRVDGLLHCTWASRLVFLESLWEEYLQDLVQELRQEDASVFEPFCEREYMAQVVRDILTGSLTTIEDVKNEIAIRFAAGITRQPWGTQWRQLERLRIGISEADTKEPWFANLAVYFEMRNCLIHLGGRVSEALRRMDAYFQDRDTIEVWPTHLDFYRKRFIDCLFHIESKIKGREDAKAAG